jgi:peptidoglycan/LPS O-acetylase OafA/YrhL
MSEPLHQTPMAPSRNSIGALRLLFASLVIVSHSPEMLDGDKRRELLTMLFGTVSFGGFAVDAFFLISGYLIAASFVGSSSVGSYFWKRVLRIYPAFLVCSLLCVVLVAPLAGAHLGALQMKDWGRVLYRLVTLKPPEVAGSFTGLPYPALNGSAWTIGLEFRCYILAAVFGLMGLYKRRALFLALTVALVATNLVFLLPIGATITAHAPRWFTGLVGEPHDVARLLSAFVVGSCFWLFRDRIVYGWRLGLVSAIALVGLMFVPVVGEMALFVLGGYLLFWVAFKATWKPLLEINAKDDISYGVYLYAWPVAALLIWYWRGIPVVLLGALTLTLALLLGAVSWWTIEKPALRLKRFRLGAGLGSARLSRAPKASKASDSRS